MDTKLLDQLIVGRVEPHIYAFSTNTVPNYLKVGDTYRPVSVRLEEWKNHFPDLRPQFEDSAKINDEVFFRDYAVHQFLEQDLGKVRLTPKDLPKGIYYSNEFFKQVKPSDVKAAIADVKKEFEEHGDKYNFYSTKDSLPVEQMYESTGMWKLRPNQDEAVKAFEKAVSKGRTNLLMYAVMRFGKSFTSLCCAQKMNKGKGAKLVVVVSAKADVKDEWRKTVQSADNFRDDYDFLSSDDLKNNYSLLLDTLKKKKVVLFLTLQDLQGEDIKDKHKQLFAKDVDLLIVDETHFGARAEKYGQVLQSSKKQEDVDDEAISFEEAEAVVKQLKAKVTLHLSGTPYRILMGGEFEKEDIIVFCQFTNIVKAQKKWDEEHLLEDESGKKPRNEWDNPYYGFPQMIRFAFNPNESSLKKMETLRAEGKTAKISALFEPQDGKKGKDAAFIHEKEVLDLLQIIDGTKTDSNILSFLNYDRLKEGKMCRHIVFVLPRCASCDALENLIRKNEKLFKNLAAYEILNISGVNGRKCFKTPKSVKQKIHDFEVNGSRTITLTVNRMLTGSTVEEWDTMIYLKDSSSPQEYDQAIFRLQNQFVKKYVNDNGDEIKFNMKPQTLLVDFDPARMFSMQELKSQIYNVNVDESGNSKLSERIAEELEISPIVYFNKGKINQVQATDLLNIVSEYSQTRGVAEETNDIPVDLGLMNNSTIWDVISKQNELGSKSGFTVKPNEGDGDDIEPPDANPDDEGNPGSTGDDSKNETDAANDDDSKDKKDPAKQFRMYYARILFFAFLTKSDVISLSQLIGSLNDMDNRRICKNLGLNKDVLIALNKGMNSFMLSKLDYKIQHLNTLAHDKKIDPLKRAEVANQKFGRISDSEIVTPSNIADEMVAQLPKKSFSDSVKNKTPILDIAAKEGEFAIALCKRFDKLGVKPAAYKNLVYSIPTSSVAYEFTRKIYEVLGLNINCIANQFNSYDILNVKTENGKDLDYEKIKKLLGQKKRFNEISLDDEVSGEPKMKFSAVVGNPPYQVVNKGDGNGADPIYHLFVDVARTLSIVGTLIHPARCLFNAGKTPKEWNQKILQDSHFKVSAYHAESGDVFPSVDIKGGVAVTEWNEKKNFGEIGFFTTYAEMTAITKKVLQKEFKSFSSLVYPRDLYHLVEKLYVENPWAASRPSKGHRYDVGSNIFDLFSELFFEEKPNDDEEYACVFGRIKNERNLKWMKKDYLKLPDNFNAYKVMITKANGSGSFGEPLSAPVIGEPQMGHTLTFLSVGKFSQKNEAEACLKYIKSKFARAMLDTLKVTQDNPRETWNNVPLQDFSSHSDIDWTKSTDKVDVAALKKYKLNINEIDAQLYAKYKLTPEEITFIETHVKEM